MSDSYNTCGDKNCCDHCQVCDSCDGGAHGECNVSQNFCRFNQNAAYNVGFSNPWQRDDEEPIKPGDIVIKRLPRERYNAILNCIQDSYNYGVVDSGLIMSVTPETGDFITASKTMEIVAAINKLNGQVVEGIPELQKDVHIVYAKYFNEITKGLMKMELKDFQCNFCNAACDAQCKTCDSCNNCDTGACYTCVTCNSCNSVTTWSCSQWSCSQWSCSQWADASGGDTTT